jgi:hypothetical protein
MTSEARGGAGEAKVAYGAYGVELRGLPSLEPWLLPTLAGWPAIEVERRVAPPSRRGGFYCDGRMEVALASGGRIVVERAAARASVTSAELPSDEELIHPYLAYIAAAVAHWHGRRESFHAGAFVAGGGAWGLAGTRELGKSTTLAWIELEGGSVVADDVLVVEDASVFAGPRALDLRADPARRLGRGRSLGVVGTRERWRIDLRPIAQTHPLCGWIFLAWGERAELVSVPAHERVRRLAALRMVTMPPSEPARLLDLAALPAWEFRRPQGLDSLASSARYLLAELARS